MSTDRLRRGLSGLAVGLVGTHLVATILQNTPESYNQDLRLFTGGWPVPGWRFFAPNPGVQNVHLLVRERARATAEPTPWTDITPAGEHGWLRVLWNPGSRGPKALFDAMQQLTVMSANHADFAWVRQSTPYELVSSVVRAGRRQYAGELQFLLVNVFPAAPPEGRFKPIVTSAWLPAHEPVREAVADGT